MLMNIKHIIFTIYFADELYWFGHKNRLKNRYDGSRKTFNKTYTQNLWLRQSLTLIKYNSTLYLVTYGI